MTPSGSIKSRVTYSTNAMIFVLVDNLALVWNINRTESTDEATPPPATNIMPIASDAVGRASKCES